MVITNHVGEINKMRKTKNLFIFIFSLLVFMMITPKVSAGECEYGTMKAWFSKDGINWENATVHNATSKLGESFFIKAVIRSKIDLVSIDVKIWETGENNVDDSTYELLEGPSCFFTYYDIYPVSKNDSFTYIWKFRVKPDTEWVDGNAPLNIYTQFDKTDQDNDGISFTIVNMYIQNILWNNYTESLNDTINTGYDNNTGSDITPANNPGKPLQNTNKTPDFKITGIVMALVLIMLFFKRNG